MLWRKIQYWWQARKYAPRGLYGFWEGRRLRWVDPMAVRAALMCHPTIAGEQIADAAELGQEPQQSQFCQLVAEAFGTQLYAPATGQGITIAEARLLIEDFELWLDAQKKNTSPGPTSSPPTAWESCDCPAAPASTGNCSSACGPVPDAPTTAAAP